MQEVRVAVCPKDGLHLPPGLVLALHSRAHSCRSRIATRPVFSPKIGLYRFGIQGSKTQEILEFDGSTALETR